MKDSRLDRFYDQMCSASASRDEPGGFSRAIRVLADAGISVEYAYAFITPEVGAAYVIIRVENNEDATAVLTKAGIKLIEQNEIFA